jgi:FkbM family methyltransferase
MGTVTSVKPNVTVPFRQSPSEPFGRPERSRLRAWLRYRLCRFPALFGALLRATRGSPEFRAIAGFVPRGGVVLDIGANNGEFALLFSYLAGSAGKVCAFEPVPETLRHLQFRLKTEGFLDNVIVTAAACGDHGGNVELTVPPGDPGQASLKTHSHGSWAGVHRSLLRKHTVPMLRLDTFWDSTDLRRCDLLKCDVEGAELLVLRGATRLLQEHRPILLLESFDAWSRDFGYTRHELVHYARSIGYDTIFLIRSVVEEIAASSVPQGAECGNLVFLIDRLHAAQIRHLRRLALEAVERQ